METASHEMASKQWHCQYSWALGCQLSAETSKNHNCFTEREKFLYLRKFKTKLNSYVRSKETLIYLTSLSTSDGMLCSIPYASCISSMKGNVSCLALLFLTAKRCSHKYTNIQLDVLFSFVSWSLLQQDVPMTSLMTRVLDTLKSTEGIVLRLRCSGQLCNLSKKQFLVCFPVSQWMMKIEKGIYCITLYIVGVSVTWFNRAKDTKE